MNVEISDNFNKLLIYIQHFYKTYLSKLVMKFCWLLSFKKIKRIDNFNKVLILYKCFNFNNKNKLYQLFYITLDTFINCFLKIIKTIISF